jgi:uncharacterized membrane protein YphA (DoxX/SURF4 family)
MQRLFSTFPEGWPGSGLLLLRAIASIPPVQLAIQGFLTKPSPAHLVLQSIAALAATLLLPGFWTPIAGVSLALIEFVLAFSPSCDPWLHILLGTFGTAVSMLGPGAWSVDARLFGRKRIHLS